MCGISGLIDQKQGKDSIESNLVSMMEALQCRGPDSMGYRLWEHQNYSSGFGHTRLAIIDPSDSGNQPMSINKYHLIFNGEIYNYQEIKRILENRGYLFDSGSDSEVIIRAFEEWGGNCVNEFIGMFAFAIYDENVEKLYLFRDRLGVKPLYYFLEESYLVFASELKAILQNNSIEPQICEEALVSYFQFGYLPSNYSIIKKCQKVPPGSYLVWDLNYSLTEYYEKKYWNSDNYYLDEELNLSQAEIENELEKIIQSAVDYRMVSDVPVSIFLSGGYDSSGVLSYLAGKKYSLNTVSVGFKYGIDEAPDAKEIAAHFNTHHNEIYCTGEDAKNALFKWFDSLDEPFGDDSIIPTVFLSQETRKNYKVALSADGGDELFAGYSRYQKLNHKVKALNSIPKAIRFPLKIVTKLLSRIIPKGAIKLKGKVSEFAKILNKNDFEQSLSAYKAMDSAPEFLLSQLLTSKVNDIALPLSYNRPNRYKFNDILKYALATDALERLPNQMLVKVDRASMASSLEAREPLLDHRLFEYAAKIPLKFKQDNKSGKLIFKNLIHKTVPKYLLDRPKRGFTPPIFEWLRGDLNYILRENLEYVKDGKIPFINYIFVKYSYNKFMNNNLYYNYIIWRLLVYIVWYRKWILKDF